ncbi:hypothetical protein [Jatrophihabitans fulvus]
MPISTTARRGTLALAAGLIVTAVPGIAAAAPAFTPDHASTQQARSAASAATVRIATGRNDYVAGDRITLFGHVPAANAAVTFYQRFVNHKDAHVIYRGRTNSKGNVVISGKASYSSAFSLHWAGRSASTTARVHVRLAQRPSGYYKTVGSYRIYRVSSGGKLSAAVAPSKVGKQMYFQLQRHSSAGWRTIQTRHFTIRKGSVAGVTFKGVVGAYYRIRSYYRGDAANSGNTYYWSYARFTN